MTLRVLLMPALACDEDLYAPLRVSLRELGASDSGADRAPQLKAAARELADARFISVRYGDAHRREPLSAYGARQVYEQHANVNSGGLDCDLVIGTSFGGMCTQAAIHAGVLRAKALVLISTCFSGRDLQPWLYAFRWSFGLLPYLPNWTRRMLLQLVAWLFPIVRRRIAEPARMRAMIRRSNLSYLFESGRMIAEWRASDAPDQAPRGLPERTLFVHGRRDPVIAFSRVAAKRRPDVAPAGGDHIMIMTRPDELAREIAGWWAQQRG